MKFNFNIVVANEKYGKEKLIQIYREIIGLIKLHVAKMLFQGEWVKRL